jgi:uncharacterized Tic20 family protein
MTEPNDSAQENPQDAPAGGPAASANDDAARQAADKERATRQWSMMIHFSVLASWLIPLAGIVVPIVLWQMKKDELPGIVPHAHVVMNWIVTSVVYALISLVLVFIVVGIFTFWALALATLVFSVIGGLKANEGELWEYPGTIIKVFK